MSHIVSKFSPRLQVSRLACEAFRTSALTFAFVAPLLCTSLLPALPAPVPNAELQAAAEKGLREKYHDEFALTRREDRTAFAKKLLADSIELKPEEAATRFVMLRSARDVAAQAGDAHDAFGALDALGAAFAIDVVQMRLTMIPVLARASAESPAESAAVAASALAQIEASLARFDDKTAETLLPIAQAAAERGGNAAGAVRESLTKIIEQRSASTRLKAVTDKLAANPADPAANFAAGSLLCLERGDFDAGLPKLAKGADPALADLAKRDLAAGDAAIIRVALGHDWWDVADAAKDSGKFFARQRAAMYYRSAIADLEGPRKEAISKRISEADEVAKQFQHNNAVVTLDAKSIQAARVVIDSAPTELMQAEALAGDKTINPAAGEKAFVLQGPLTVPEGVNVTVTIAAGTEIRGGEFQMSRTGHIVVNGTREKPVIFRNVIFQHDLGGSFEGDWVVFDNCQFLKQCCWFEYASSKWRFTNCILYKCKFGGLTGVDYGFQIRHCALISMELPEIAHDQSAADFDHMKHLRTEWNTIQNCDFLDCSIPPTLAWCAERSNFIACGFLTGEPFRSATPLTATLFVARQRGAEPQAASNENPPIAGGAVTFQKSDHAFDAGALLPLTPIPEIRMSVAGIDVANPIIPAGAELK